MTIQGLLDELKRQHAQLGSAIEIVESYIKSSKTKATRKKIVAHVKKKSKKGFSYKGKHWTQDPKNKAKLRRMLRKSLKKRNGK